MKNNQIQEILDLSSLTMVDPEYTMFTTYIKKGLYTNARLFIESFLEELQNKIDTSDDAEGLVDQCVKCARLEDLVYELIIGKQDVNDKPKRVRQRIKQ